MLTHRNTPTYDNETTTHNTPHNNHTQPAHTRSTIKRTKVEHIDPHRWTHLNNTIHCYSTTSTRGDKTSSRQLLKMGTWLPETRWATCKAEINDNTKVTSSWFLINTEWQCTVNHTSGIVKCCSLYRYCLMYERLTFWLFQFDILMLEFCKLFILFHHRTVHLDIIKFILFTNWCTNKFSWKQF